MNEEDGAGGAEGMPDISGVDGFVGNDDEQEEQKAARTRPLQLRTYRNSEKQCFGYGCRNSRNVSNM